MLGYVLFRINCNACSLVFTSELRHVSNLKMSNILAVQHNLSKTLGICFHCKESYFSDFMYNYYNKYYYSYTDSLQCTHIHG